MRNKLPLVRQWIEEKIEQYQADAMPLSTLPFFKLKKCFSQDLLSKTKVVICNGPVPVPPLKKMGITFSDFESQQPVGITLKDTISVKKEYQLRESLYFHELVHVIQWQSLGTDKFLFAYGAGLLQHGYRDSPLEDMAYTLEAAFRAGSLGGDVEAVVRDRTERVWGERLRKYSIKILN